jgi:hypothetical protein
MWSAGRAAGPRAVAMRSDHQRLLRTAGHYHAIIQTIK